MDWAPTLADDQAARLGRPLPHIGCFIAPPLANLVISNVPGLRRRLYLNRARLVDVYPLSALAASIGLNVTFTSYHDRMDFGFVGNGAEMHELPILARHVEAAYGELKLTGQVPPDARRAARPKRS